MKKFSLLCALFVSFTIQSFAYSNFEFTYPPCVQAIHCTDIFRGDSHHQFEGDLVAVLTDGSAWKVHPKDREKYAVWSQGERVRIKVRTDWYWFSRQHKFWLYNQDRGEVVKVMLAQHKLYPFPNKIESTEVIKRDQYVTEYEKVQVFEGGRWIEKSVAHQRLKKVPYQKIIRLTDGAIFVIKNPRKFDAFQMGAPVYVGAQGAADVEFDFILITGFEREVTITRGKLQ